MGRAFSGKCASYLVGLVGSLGFGVYALDVSYFGAVKSARYAQTNSSAPALLASNAFAFTAFAISTNGMLTNATVRPPNTTPARTLTSDTNRMNWQYEEFFNSQATTNWLNWLELFVTNLPGTPGSFTDTQAAGFESRFYRIRVGP
jgi:hypothetical protein